MSTLQYPNSFQESIIDLALNSLLLEALLLGVYTVAYFSTLYIYLTRKSSHHWIVAGTISVLYLLYVAQISVQWYNTKYTFVNNGQTQETVFMAALVTPAWITFVNATCSLLEGVLADGLLLWRCFNVWNRSLHIIALPSFLLLSEIALNLTVIVMSVPNDYSPNQIQTLNKLIGASTFITFGTTLVVTFLISYRIHSTSKQNLPRGGSRLRFKYILEILIQSAAIYSLAAAASATATIIPPPLEDNGALRVLTAQVYTSSFYAFIAGVAPTIMVARVALATDMTTDISTITHISGLQFHDRFGASNSTVSRGISSHVENGEPHLLFQPENSNEKK